MARFKKNRIPKIEFLIVIITIVFAVFSIFAKNSAKFLPVEKISASFIEERLGLMRDWFVANNHIGKTLPYLYFPESNEYGKDNNIIRQLLTTQGIFALAKHLNDPALFTVGENNLATIFRNYYKFEETTGFGFFEGSSGQVKLGGAALGIVAILEGGLAEEYSSRLSALANLVEAMQQPNGSFQTFYRPINFESNDRFYSGEALLAATRLFEFSDDPKWLDFVARSFDFYEKKLKADFLPQYVPWHTMAYAAMFEVTGEQKYVDFVFWLNDRLIDEMLELNPKDPRLLGRFYSEEKRDLYGVPHSASTSIYAEGIGHAHAIAEQIADSAHEKKYRLAVILGTRSLLELQFTPQSSKVFAKPEKVVGAIRRTVDQNEMRIDQTGHSANAILEAAKILVE